MEVGNARRSGAGSERLLRRRSKLSNRRRWARAVNGSGGRTPAHTRTKSQSANSPFRLGPRAEWASTSNSRRSALSNGASDSGR